MRLELWDRQANESNEVGHAGDFDRPEAKAAENEPVADARRKRVTLCAIQWFREKLHHLGIGVQCGESGKIVIAPEPKMESIRADHWGRTHRLLRSRR
jgi:hypothetical protein